MTTVQKLLLGAGAVVTLTLSIGTAVFIGHRVLTVRGPAAPPTANPPPTSLPAAASGEEFTFKVGQRLVGPAAPPIAGRAFTIIAVFDTRRRDGVILAQGGLAHGYALYVEAGELFFALRRDNTLTTVSAGLVGEGRHTAVASLGGAGEIKVALDGKPGATAQAAGVITKTPVDGLDVGTDKGANVGLYPANFAFGGIIESVTLHLER